MQHDGWFPGRHIGGAALITGPVLWFAGLLLRHLAPGHVLAPAQLQSFGGDLFAAPMQLAAYAADPTMVTAGYACHLAGAILLIPAVITLAQIVAARAPALACWGGTLLVLGLVARAYAAGVDQTAFRLIGELGVTETTRVIDVTYPAISYGPWRVPVWASACQYPGALLLAIGAFRSGTFGTGRSLLLLWAGTLWGGVLKAGDGATSAGMLCVTLIPLGVQVLRDRVPELYSRDVWDAGHVPEPGAGPAPSCTGPSDPVHPHRPPLLSW